MQKQFILAQSLMQVDMGATETSLEENGLGKLVPDHTFKGWKCEFTVFPQTLTGLHVFFSWSGAKQKMAQRCRP
jgi:hypothetical protein